MARDRKRSRQRRPRPVREPASAQAQSQPVRADLPGALEHVGEVDEFDAALVRGAGGVPVEESLAEELGNGSRGVAADFAPSTPADRDRRPRRGQGGDQLEKALEEEAPAEQAAPTRRPSQPFHQRAIAFLRASWAELQRVQWPDRPHVTQATTVVLGFLVVAGVYLGLADWVAQKVVNFIL